MRIIGKTSECYGVHDLHPVDISDLDRPAEMPELPEGHVLIAVYWRRANALVPNGRETFEMAAVCQTFEDVRSLWDDHHKGYLHHLRFGSTDNPVGMISQLSNQ